MNTQEQQNQTDIEAWLIANGGPSKEPNFPKHLMAAARALRADGQFPAKAAGNRRCMIGKATMDDKIFIKRAEQAAARMGKTLDDFAEPIA